MQLLGKTLSHDSAVLVHAILGGVGRVKITDNNGIQICSSLS